MFPPLVGWNRFVPGSAKISCGPDWTDNSASGLSYNLALVVWGFFLPLTIMIKAYHQIYRFVILIEVVLNVCNFNRLFCLSGNFLVIYRYRYRYREAR